MNKISTYKTITAILVASFVLFLGMGVSTASAQSYIYTNQGELNDIKQKADQGKEPWSSAYDKVISNANSALNKQPRSVTDNGPQDNPHQFAADAPYQGNDGYYADDVNREDYSAAGDMGDWIRDLGLAYAMTGQDRYARKAIDFLHHWAVDSDTYMKPVQRVAGHTDGFQKSGPIVLYITMPKFAYGASMVEGHPYWDQKGQGAEQEFKQWVRDFLADAEEKGESIKNNHWPWHIAMKSSFASYLNDGGALDGIFQEWKWSTYQINSKGWLKKELPRTRSLHYSMYALKAYMLTAEIARRHNVNLYDHVNDDGGSLEKALDFHAPFVSANDPQQKWESYWEDNGQSGWGEQIRQINRQDHAIPFELAYSYWQKQPYLDVVQKAGRPLSGNYVWGDSPTLTHANLFAVSEVQADTGSSGGSDDGSSGSQTGGDSDSGSDSGDTGSSASSGSDSTPGDGGGDTGGGSTDSGTTDDSSQSISDSSPQEDTTVNLDQSEEVAEETTNDDVVVQTQAEPPAERKFTNPLPTNTISGVIALLLDAVTTIAIPIIVLMIIYAGFLFVTAQGDPGQLETAKTTLWWALIGAAIILGAQALAEVITGTLGGI